MLKKQYFLYLFCCFCVINSVAANTVQFNRQEQQWIKQHPTVKYGFGYQFPPFQIVRNGKLKGIASEFIKILRQKTGIEFIPEKYSTWQAVLSAFKQGKVELLPSVGYSKQRAKFMLFAKPNLSHPLVIVTRKKYPFVDNLSAFRGKTISLPNEYASSEFIISNYPNIHFIVRNNVNQVLEDVSTGKAAATALDLPVVSYYLYYRGFQNLKIAAPLTKMKNIQLGFVVQKKDTVFQSIINKVLASIPLEEKNQIYKKWISVQYDYVNMKKVWTYSIIALIFALVIILLISRWNKKLKKEIAVRKETENRLENSLKIIQKKNEEKQAMLKEIHHRVKNNLQIVNSLIHFQASHLKNENIKRLFEETQNRVISMSLLHEKLYKSDDLKHLLVEDYLSSLLADLIDSYRVSDEIHLKLKCEKIYLNSKTMAPLGLITNEIVTNSIKHAFSEQPKDKPKIIEINFKKEGGNTFTMEIGDNGKGLSKNILTEKQNSMGSELIPVFVEQLEGKITLLNKPGTYYKITFKEIGK